MITDKERSKRRLVYQCKICRKHWLTFRGINSHLRNNHEVNFRSVFALSELVPFAAMEFD